MALTQLAAPDLTDLSVGSATLIYLDSTGFTSDGKLLLVRATYLDDGDTSNSKHYAQFVYDTVSKEYLYSINSALGGASARSYDVESAKISGTASDYTIAAQYSLKGEDTSTLALLENGIVSDLDPVKSVSGMTLNGVGDDQVEGFLISSDGRFVAIQTTSAQFGEGVEVDSNSSPDIYLFDTLTNEVTRVSYIGGSEVTVPTYLKDIYMSDGNLQIAFVTDAPFVSPSVDDNSDSTDSGAKSDIYLWDSAYDDTGVVGTPVFSLVTKTYDNLASGYVDKLDAVKITDAGVYFSASSDLVISGDTNSAKDVFVYTFETGDVDRLNLDGVAELASGATFVSASDDGRFVSLLSDSTEIAGQIGAQQLFYVDTTTGQYEVSSSSTAGVFGDIDTVDGVVAGNGSSLAYTSLATNLTATETPTSFGSLFLVQNNTAPTGSVTISGELYEGSTLTAGNDVADADGLGTLTYQWFRDGISIDGATEATYTLVQSDATAKISVALSYVDGFGITETVTSEATARVENINDAPTGSIDIVGDLIEGTTLTLSSSINDSDGLGAFSYQWRRDNVAIDGATNDSYLLTQADVGASIQVTVSYTDAFGTAEAVVSAATSKVTNLNDLPAGDVQITGDVIQGQTLTVLHNLSDDDGLGTLSYTWLRDGEVITGAADATYVLSQADVGANIKVEVSYVDGFGTTETVSSEATSAVTNINDLPQGTLEVIGNPVLGQELTASHTITDEDGLGVVDYQWYRDGVAITNATAQRYTIHSDDLGTKISVAISYTDLMGTNESVASESTATVVDSSIDGKVYHWSSGMLLDDVEVTAKSSSDIVLSSQTTAATGSFTVNGSDGSSSVQVKRSITAADTNKVITSADALAALKIAVGLNPNADPDGDGPRLAANTSPYQMIAADVNGDGKVSSADALAILKMAVGLNDAPSTEWLFVQEGESLLDQSSGHSTLTRDNVNYDNDGLELTGALDQNVNFVGVLLGDVNGSWKAGEANHVMNGLLPDAEISNINAGLDGIESLYTGISVQDSTPDILIDLYSVSASDNLVLIIDGSPVDLGSASSQQLSNEEMILDNFALDTYDANGDKTATLAIKVIHEDGSISISDEWLYNWQ